MLRKYLFAALFASTAALYAFGAASSANAVEFLIGPYAGFEEAIDGDDGNFVWGGFARIKPSRMIGLEAAADVTEDDFLDGAIHTDNVTVMGNLLLYPIPDIFYISAGAGWTRAVIAYPAFEDEREDHFAWNAGLGLEIPVMSWLSITGDARYVFRELDFDNDTNAAARDLNTDFWMVRAGLALRFGGGGEECTY